jgi:hypothetical protein
VIYLRLFSEFERYGFQSGDLFKYLKRIIFNIILTNFVDNSNRIYEYDIDREIIKIRKLLFKFVFRIGRIFGI